MKSFPLVIAGMIPQIVTGIVVAYAQATRPVGTAALLGTVGTVVSLAIVASVGVMICTMRDLILARKHGTDPGAALSTNLGYAAPFALLSIPVAWLTLTVFTLTEIVSSELILVLAATQLPMLLVMPYAAVLNGAFQSLDRASENLFAALLQGATTLIASVVFFQPVGTMTALVLFGAVQSVGAVLVQWWRARRFRTISGLRLSLVLRWDVGIGSLIVAVYGHAAGPLWHPLTLLIVAQFLVEPLAGVLYSFVKIRIGPRAGLAGLLVVYCVLAPPPSLLS